MGENQGGDPKIEAAMKTAAEVAAAAAKLKERGKGDSPTMEVLKGEIRGHLDKITKEEGSNEGSNKDALEKLRMRLESTEKPDS